MRLLEYLLLYCGLCQAGVRCRPPDDWRVGVGRSSHVIGQLVVKGSVFFIGRHTGLVLLSGVGPATAP